MKRSFMPGRRAIRIGRLFGIDIALDLNWFFIFFIMVVSFSGQYQQYFPTHMGSMVFAIVLTLALFASVVAHEYGHALTARLFGIHTQKIVLHLFGGVAYLESEPKRPRDEFFIAIAGPAVSIVFGLVFGGIALATAPGTGIPETALFKLAFALAAMNLFLGIFNCVPGFPLDGGRVVRSALWAITGNYLKATRVASWGGIGVGALLSLTGVAAVVAAPFMDMDLLAGGILRVLLGLFVIHLARMSMKQAEFISAFHGLTVRDLMQPIRAVVPADMLLSDVRDRYFQWQGADNFPVVDGTRLLGSIGQEDFAAIPERQWDWVRAREIVRPYDAEKILDPGLEALTALERLARLNRYSLPVFQGRRLLGTVTQGDLARALQQRRAL
ncbi:MAG: hypothetical protein PWP23_306 [Candidatus Sumerlaeota bacterium]|nr:hypothetical protein [Candidatus Sumerlaeota bacterium]